MDFYQSLDQIYCHFSTLFPTNNVCKGVDETFLTEWSRIYKMTDKVSSALIRFKNIFALLEVISLRNFILKRCGRLRNDIVSRKFFQNVDPRNFMFLFNTLKEESVRGGNFCSFCGFGSNRKSLFPQKISV